MKLSDKIFTTDDLLALQPSLFHKDAVIYDWSGTLIDILNNDAFGYHDKLWLVLKLCPDAILKEFTLKAVGITNHNSVTADFTAAYAAYAAAFDNTEMSRQMSILIELING